MANQPAGSLDTNANVGTNSNPSINIGTSTATAAQPSQSQVVPYGYGFNNGHGYGGFNIGHGYVPYGYGVYDYGYQYVYPHPYPFGYEYAEYPQYPYAAPPPQAVAASINGHETYYDVSAYQFQPATVPQTQHYSYLQQLQSQQSQTGRSDRGQQLQSQQSQTGRSYRGQQLQSQQSQTGRSDRGQQLQSQQSETGRSDRGRNWPNVAASLEKMQRQGTHSGIGSGSGSFYANVHGQYNLPGFITRYANAKFFVIKSYSKEHVLSSIRYGVWTSTRKGNLVLDAAYAEAASGEQRAQGGTANASSSNCPIFLLFSVNKSGNFCGVAEMVGPVDFGARTDFWEWKDKFPVKWHMIKDVPFREIVHITLESNENESIICSRDTQKVEKEKGEEMLDKFKNYVSASSLLNEISFPVELLVRRPPSPSPPLTREKQHEQQAEEKLAAASSCISRSNTKNTQEEDSDNNTQEEKDRTKSQESDSNHVISVTSHSSSYNNKKQDEEETESSSHNKKKQDEEETETDHNYNLEYHECEKSQESESTVIGVSNPSPSNNKKQEDTQTDHNNTLESECEKGQESESIVISVSNPSPSNKKKKQETD